jgi:hypothetical protein
VALVVSAQTEGDMGERDLLGDGDRVDPHPDEQRVALRDVGVTPFGTRSTWLDRVVRRLRGSR